MLVNRQVKVGANWTMIYQADPIHCLIVNNLHVNNGDAQQEHVSLCIVPPGQNPTSANALTWLYNVPAVDFIEHSQYLVVPPGYTIQAQGSATDMCLSLSGELSKEQVV